MNVLIVGGGGRGRPGRSLKAPASASSTAHLGNPGIAELGTLHDVSVDDTEGLAALSRRLRADLVVIGPEAPLVGGLADALH